MERGRAAEYGMHYSINFGQLGGGTDIFVGFQRGPWLGWLFDALALRNPTMTFLCARNLAMQIRRETVMERIIDC